MEMEKPNRIEVMLMLFAELRKRIIDDNPDSDELAMFEQFDELVSCYRSLRNQTTSALMEETFEPFMPLIEEAIDKLKSELDYHDLTDTYRELEQIESQLRNSEELTESQINILLDRRAELLKS